MEKFKPGDMVSVTTENRTGIGFVYNTYMERPEEGILVASIVWSVYRLKKLRSQSKDRSIYKNKKIE